MKMLVPLALAVSWAGWAVAQPALRTQDGETPLTPGLAGDQVQPALSLSASGGFLVWRDNGLNGGAGVAALNLGSAAGIAAGRFQVNGSHNGFAEKPQVAMLNDGGAVFVWQAGRQGFPEVYARFLGADGQFVTDDVQVSAAWYSFTNRFTTNITVLRNNRPVVRRYRMTRVVQDRSEVNANPAVAVLEGGDVLVAYAAVRRYITNEPVMNPMVRFLYNRFFTNSILATDPRNFDSLADITVQRFSAVGQKVGDPFVANRMMNYNQRDAAIAPLKGGGFVVSWISEHRQILGPPGASVSGSPLDLALNLMEVYARVFDGTGAPLGDEFLVDQTPLATAAPTVAALPEGGFRVAWAQRDTDRSTGWDVYTRAFNAAGSATEAAARVNSYTFGDQYSPKIAALPQGEVIIWSSLGQDGSYEGVYGQWISGGQWVGSEFRVNTTTAGRQLQPAVAADGSGSCLAVWASLPGRSSYDLFGQRFVISQP